METLCYWIKSGNYTVQNYEILRTSVNASIHCKKTLKQCVAIATTVRNKEILKNKLKPSFNIVQTIETMCFGLKSGNYTVRN